MFNVKDYLTTETAATGGLNISCIGCDHLYYDSGGEGHCNMPYEHSCLKLLHRWHTNPALFIEDVLNVKLKWYQRIYLKFFNKK